jgi:hypothetical protein
MQTRQSQTRGMHRRARLRRTALSHGLAGAILSLPLLIVVTVLQHIPGTCEHLLPTVGGAWLLTTAAAAFVPTALVAALPEALQRAAPRGVASVAGAALTAAMGAMSLTAVHEALVAGPMAALRAPGLPAEPGFALGMTLVLCLLALAPWGATEWSMRRGA